MQKIVVIVELDWQMGTVGKTGQSCINSAHCSVV